MSGHLPYEIGNVGDLLKHGFLAEFVYSWHSHCSDPLVFLDPFGGLPSCKPARTVVSRLLELDGTALRKVQSEIPEKYYGSSMLVRRAGEVFDVDTEIYVSDNNPSCLDQLLTAGLRTIEAEGFDKTDSYSIVNVRLSADLLLMDPFQEFVPHKARTVIPKLMLLSNRMTVIVFVLNLDPGNRYGQRYRELLHQQCNGAWLARCPPLSGTQVRGESTYHIELLIVPSAKLTENTKTSLFSAFKDYCQKLGSVLGTEISLETIKGEVTVGRYCRGCGTYFPPPQHPKECYCGPIGRNRRRFCEFCGKPVGPPNRIYCHHCKQVAGKP